MEACRGLGLQIIAAICIKIESSSNRQHKTTAFPYLIITSKTGKHFGVYDKINALNRKKKVSRQNMLTQNSNPQNQHLTQQVLPEQSRRFFVIQGLGPEICTDLFVAIGALVFSHAIGGNQFKLLMYVQRYVFRTYPKRFFVLNLVTFIIPRICLAGVSEHISDL